MLSSSAIEPGGSGKIKTSIMTAGKAGRVMKSIAVKSNDPQRPQINLIIEVYIEAAQNAGEGKKSP